MKRLKSGQLCTIKGHVYRCTKNVTPKDPCIACIEDDNKILSCAICPNYGRTIVLSSCIDCIKSNKKCINNSVDCYKTFGSDYHPVLVK